MLFRSIDLDMAAGRVVRYLIRGINITGYNLNKAGITLTDMERTAQRLAALAAAETADR